MSNETAEAKPSLPLVMIAIPSDGWIQFVVMNTVLNLSQDPRYNKQILLGHQKPYENNQHHLVKAALECKADWLLMMDADNPPTGNALDYIEKDCDIVSFPTPVWKADKEIPWHFNVYRQRGLYDFVPHTPCKGFVEVEATGSGCLLLSRKVLETIPGPFASEWNEDGTRKLGGDLAFSVRARKAGFKIMAAFDCPCLHFTWTEGLRSIQQIDQHYRMMETRRKAGEVPDEAGVFYGEQPPPMAFGQMGLSTEEMHEKAKAGAVG